MCVCVCVCLCVCVCTLSCVWLFTTSWTVAHQSPLSMEFSRQEYWNGVPFCTPGDLPNPEIELHAPFISCIDRQIHYPCTTWKATHIFGKLPDFSSGQEQECPLSPQLLSIVIILYQPMLFKKRKQRHINWKERGRTISAYRWNNHISDKSKESWENCWKPQEFNKIADFKINM